MERPLDVLILADSLLPPEIFLRRAASDTIQYRSLRTMEVALSALPHGVPMGATVIATVLQQKFRVRILECAFRPLQETNLEYLLSLEPAVICVSTTFIMDAENLGRHVAKMRSISPRSKIVFGGPSLYANLKMRDLADYCLIGEGEENVLPLVEGIILGKDVSHVPGVYFRRNDRVVETEPRLAVSMDDLPWPDWSLLKRGPECFYLISTQRGCRWRCAFCTYPANEGYKLRYRSIPSLIAEIRRNYELFGINKYMFSDSTFSHPHDRCLEFLREVAKLPFRIEWAAFVRVDTITAELAEAMRRSGCVGLFFGLDSGDDRVLLKMKKGFTKEQARAGFAHARANRLPITASWIVGFPGETRESVRNTLDFILELRAEHNSVNVFSLYDEAPIGFRRNVFGIEGHGTNWKHETMNSRQADRHARWVILKCMEAKLPLGTFFDYFWLSSAGIGTQEVITLFRDAQAISGAGLRGRGESAEPADVVHDRVNECCKRIWQRSIEHPIYADLRHEHLPQKRAEREVFQHK